MLLYCLSVLGEGSLTCGSLWGFYFLFTLLRGFLGSFSILLLSFKGRGSHTLLNPYETNCDFWIWAIQIKLDWLIDYILVPYLRCSAGDRIWQCGWWVQTQRPHVLLQKPNAWVVDHRRQPSLHLLPVLHVCQHHGAKQPAQVSPACLCME